MSVEQMGALIAGIIIFISQIAQIVQSSKQGKKLQKEFVTNGGKSIKDQLNRIENIMDVHTQRVRTLLSDYDILLFETDKHGDCIWVNRHYLEVMQRSMEDVLGNGWVMCISPGDRKNVYDNWVSVVDEHRQSDLKFTMISAGGIHYPVHAKTYVLKNPEGDVEGYIGSIKIIEAINQD